MIQDLLEKPLGRIFLSIILGLGLAAIFRQVCKGDECVIIKGPKKNDLEKYYYKIEDDCFKYTPYDAPCESEATSKA
jgi:hypothetical protein